MTVKDLMERRLQTVVYRKGLARTIHQARQFVSHGHVSVAGNVVSVPSYMVERDDEGRIVFHEYSPLNNPQHPVRAVAGAKRAVPRLVEEAPTAPGPALPAVPAEIKEIVQDEQPLVLPEPEEELPAEGEAAPEAEKPQQPT